MKEIFTESIIIDSRLESVWNYFVNLEENATKWMNGIPSMEKETPGVIKEGTNFVFQARGKEHSTTISEFDPMKKIMLTSIQGSFQADYLYIFTNQGNSTKIALIAKCKAKGASKILSPLIKMAIKKSDSGQLANFKKAFINKP